MRSSKTWQPRQWTEGAGDALVEHQTRASFMRATGKVWVANLGESPPVPELTEEGERQIHASLRAAFSQPRPRDISPPDLRAEGRGRMERNRERPML
jgi:hypothetical protein